METRVGGIAGKVSFYGAAVTDAEISALIESVPHRSPSGAKVRTFETGALVSLFLQTERNEYEVSSAPGYDQFIAVIHGDIHNSEEVLSQLGREQTADQISTEQLIVASYIKWGDQCPLYLLGDYTFAIWDPQRAELFCARDAIGIKPFHYFHQDGVFIFGSEIDQVATHANAREALDIPYILAFTNDSVSDRESTFFKNIKRLPAANCIRVSAEGVTQSRYWDPLNLPLLDYQTVDQYVDEFGEIFSEAIRARMPAPDEKLGILLSGGVDSTSVLAEVRTIQGEASANDKLQALSLGFYGLPCDESQIIRANAEKLEVELHLHQHGPISHRAVLDSLKGSLGPPESAPAIAYGELFDFARENNVAIVMGGWGADDWLGLHGGIYYDLLAAGQFRLLSQRLSHSIASYGIDTTCRLFFTECVRNPLARQVKRFALALQLPLFKGRADYVSEFDEGGWRSSTKWNQYRWLNSPLFALNCEMQELSAARRGVETRYPYNDRRIVEFGLRLNLEILARSASSKPVIRGLLARNAREIDPESYLDPEGSPIYWQSLRQLYLEGNYDLSPLYRYLQVPPDYGDLLVESLKNPEYDEAIITTLARKQWHSYTTSIWLESFFASADGVQ